MFVRACAPPRARVGSLRGTPGAYRVRLVVLDPRSGSSVEDFATVTVLDR